MQGTTTQALERCLSILGQAKHQKLIDLLDHAASVFSGNETSGVDCKMEAACAVALSRLGKYYTNTDTTTTTTTTTTDDLCVYNVIQLASQYDSVYKQLHETNCRMEEASLLADVESQLACCDAKLAEGTFTKAAHLLVECSTRFAQALPKLSETNKTSIEQALQSRTNAIRSKLFSTMLDCLQRNNNDDNNGDAQNGELQDALEAAATLQLIVEAFDIVGTSIFDGRILPLLHSAQHITKADLSVEKYIYKSLKYLCELFSPFLRGEMLAQAAQGFWHRVSQAYLKAKLVNTAVDTAPVQRLQFYMRAGAVAIKLEQKAEKLGLLPLQSHGRGPLATAVAISIQDAENALRGQFLASARDTLLSCSGSQKGLETVYISPSLHDDDTEPQQLSDLQVVQGIPSLEQAVGGYLVSKNAAQLAHLMQDVLQDNPSPTMLCAVGESASCLAVAFLTTDSSTSLEDAAIRYNDCMHLFRVLTKLGARFPSVLQAGIITEKTGSRALRQALTREKDRLIEEYVNLLMPSNTSGLAYDGPAIIRQKKVVRQLLSSISDCLSPLWQVLDRDTAVCSIGYILNSLAKALISDLLGMEDISEELAAQIPNQILGDVVAFVEVDEEKETTIPALVWRATHDSYRDAAALMGVCHDVERLVGLCHLLTLPSSRDIALEFSLKELNDSYPSETATTATAERPRKCTSMLRGLTPHEVVHMITALYEDTEYRSQSIDMIWARKSDRN